MARKRKAVTKRRAAPRRRVKARTRRRVTARRAVSARSYRNPPVIKTLTAGAMDGVLGFAGATFAGYIANKLPNFIDPPAKDPTSSGDVGKTVNAVLSGLAVGMVARMVLGESRARAVATGAFMVPISAVLTPQLQKAGILSGYSRGRLAAYVHRPALSAYVHSRNGQLGAYTRSPSMLSGYETEDVSGAGAAF